MPAAQKLKTAIGNAPGGTIRAQVDFRNVFSKVETVTISIWHNTGDDCGAPCYYLHLFIQGMADIAKTLAPGAVRFP